MVERLLAANPDARTEWISHKAEDVLGTAGPIGPGHGLQRQRAGSQDQVEPSVRDLPRNRVLGRCVILRVKSLDRDGFALLSPPSARPSNIPCTPSSNTGCDACWRMAMRGIAWRLS